MESRADFKKHQEVRNAHFLKENQMSSLNKVTLIGHLGANPEIRYLSDGTAIATVSLATTDKWKDKITGQIKEQTEWHRLVFYKKLAEIANEYLKKGALVFIEGKLHTNKWTDKNQIERYTTEIVVKEMQMLGGKKSHKEEEILVQQTAGDAQLNEVYDVPF